MSLRDVLWGPATLFMRRAAFVVAAALLVWTVLPAVAGSPQGAPTARQGVGSSGSAGTAARAVVAANAFIGMLNDAERAKALYPFDNPQKTNWSNLPTGIYQRNSLRLGDVTPAQRDAVMALMAVVLSREGYQKATDIMNGDEFLKNNPAGGGGGGGGRGRQGGGARAGQPGQPATAPAGGGPPAPSASTTPPLNGQAPAAAPAQPGRQGGGRGGGPSFGLAEYYIAILGTPSVTTPWMVQFGGHHLALNVTIVGGNNAMTPSLPAAQPTTYTLNGQSIRPLGDENDKGFALINALDANQQAQAILPSRVTDLVLGPGQDGKVIQPEGIVATSLTPAQQTMLLDLAHEWVGILNDEGANAKMAEIRSNLARTYFAWSGPTTNGSVAYFRIQGPTVLIEYAPQNSVDHVHTIYRDPTNDYGARFVRP